jgi:hypothetical protein
VSYDLDMVRVGPGQELEDAVEAIAEADAPPTAEEAALRDRLAAALTAAGLGFEVVHTDEHGELQLDDGIVQVDLSGRMASLNAPYWGDTDRDALARAVFGVLTVLREQAGWRALDPQLGRELTAGDRDAFLAKYDEGVALVRRLGGR